MHVVSKGYDLIYVDDKEYGLYINDNRIAINVSDRQNYLKDKLKAHRKMENQNGNLDKATYYIKDLHGVVIYRKEYMEGETSSVKDTYHKTNKNKINTITVDNFDLICDKNGNILTDTKLMHIINDYIFIKRLPIPNSRVVSVSLATHKPQTKDEFVKCHGLGEKVYNKCGEELLNLIQTYIGDYKE